MPVLTHFKRIWTWYLRASLAVPFGVIVLLVLAKTGNFTARMALVETRQILFGVRFDDTSFLRAAPSRLQEQYGFKAYEPGSIEPYRSGVISALHRDSLQGRIVDADRWAFDVTQTFSGFGGRACGEYADLLDAMQRLARGSEGCCSDHTMVFLAVANFDGVFARELHNAEHTFVEYWNPMEERYVWLDPYLGLRAKSKGRYVGVSDMLDLIDQGETWEFEFVGAENPVRRIDVRKVKGLRPQDFVKVGMTLGNDVYAEDRAVRDLRFFPRPVAQALMLISGKQAPIGFSYDRMLPHRPLGYYYGYIRYLLIFQAIITCVAVFGVARGFVRHRHPTV